MQRLSLFLCDAIRQNWTLTVLIKILTSVTGEKVAGIDLDSDVLEFFACAIGEDSLGESLKFCKVVDHAAAEEGGAIFKRGFIDDYGCPFCLDAFHHALY